MRNPLAALDRLAPDQRAAATAPVGPILCVAPAGSGKTATLVARIVWLIRGPHRADPSTICAVTFNRRAAEELRSRLEGALRTPGTDDAIPRVRTFHALGREILGEAGVDVSALVDRANLLRTLFPDAPASTLRVLDDAFARLKLDLRAGPAEVAEMAGVGEEARAGKTRRAGHTAQPPRGRTRPGARDPGGRLDPRIAAAFLSYQAALAERGALDFDDLVVRAHELLRQDPHLLARWRGRCGHLLVDEVQDVDRTQLDLAVLLAGPERRIFLVGDDDQTIYAWRLADVRRVIGLAERLPGLQRFDLTVNYRCPAPVVQRAVRLVQHNRERFRKTITARSEAVGHLLLAPLPTDEVTRARRVLARWVEDGLPRDTRQSIEHAPADMDGMIVGVDAAHGAADASAPADDTRWAVLARTNAELAPYAAVALEMGIAFSAEEHGLLVDDPRVERILGMAEEAAEPADHPLAAIARLRTNASVGGVPGAPTHRVFSSLLTWAAPFLSLAELRQAIAETRRRLAVLHRDDAPLVLATVHGTKGLEFDHVAVVGLDEGRFPNRRSLEESGDPARALEEERRLAYVAWTRAKRTLILVYDPGAPSPFLREAFSEAELVA